MLLVTLHSNNSPCDSCGHTAFALLINIRYRVGDRWFRVNEVQPCGCLLGVTDVTNGEPDWRRRRRSPRRQLSVNASAS